MRIGGEKPVLRVEEEKGFSQELSQWINQERG